MNPAKTFKYMKALQQLCYDHMDDHLGFLDAYHKFQDTQSILKRPPFKTDEDALKIYFYEYATNFLMVEFTKLNPDITALHLPYQLLYRKINTACLDIGYVTTDSIYIWVITNIPEHIKNTITGKTNGSWKDNNNHGG